MKACSIYECPWVPENDPENDLENEFQFQLQGYAPSGERVNPLCHKRA
jgi:hypothetical protein